MGLLAAPLLSQARSAPGERLRYADPATELVMYRLTSPAVGCYLPPCESRAVARHNSFLVYWSDRTGSAQAYRLEISSGASAQITNAAALDGSTLALSPDDRYLYFFDGAALMQQRLGSSRSRESYRVPPGWNRASGLRISADGRRGCLVETQNNRWALRQIGLPGGQARTLIETSFAISDPLPRPQSAGILFRRADRCSLWDGSVRDPELAAGKLGAALWAPDGASLFYLHSEAAELRQFDFENNQDRLVSATSRFAQFQTNGDASVFVGASSSLASPYILLLDRRVRREMALCEHRSRDIRLVAPRFSPESQRVYFGSNRDGQPALYMAEVEKLVEET